MLAPLGKLLWTLRPAFPLISGGLGRRPALDNLPTETGLSHGGMCSLLCPNVGCRISCAVLPVIVPWVNTSSDWQMRIRRTCVFIMTYTSYTVRMRESSGVTISLPVTALERCMNARQFLDLLVFLHLPFYPWARRCPGVLLFHPFKSKNIAGRIKIKLLGFSCEHLPTCICCFGYKCVR